MSIAINVAAKAPKSSTGRHWSRRIKVGVGTALLIVVGAYVVLPIYWLIIASSKTTPVLFDSGTFAPASHLSWLANLRTTLTFGGGEFKSWFGNSIIYATVTAFLTTLVCAVCGYGLAKYRFRMRRVVFGLVLGALMIPFTALVVPLFLLEHAVHLNNTYEGVILPSLVFPFGVYFMSIFAADAVPDTLIDSCRVDGSGEFGIFWRVARPILMPGMVTLFLLSFVGTWNNFFLPLVLLGSTSKFPLTVGLSTWASSLNNAGVGIPLYPEVLIGSLVSVLPMLVLFPFLQKYIARGLTFGAVAGE